MHYRQKIAQQWKEVWCHYYDIEQMYKFSNSQSIQYKKNQKFITLHLTKRLENHIDQCVIVVIRRWQATVE